MSETVGADAEERPIGPMVKAALHDATPSWNGFNYQGKVGLLVALNRMDDCLASKGVDALKELAGKLSLEYEWVEDFSIKESEKYLSLHQVKHYDATAFNKYCDAIETIVGRKLGVLTFGDIQSYAYVFFDEDVEEKAKELARQLKECSVVDEEWRISPDWENCLAKVQLEYRFVAKKCIEGFNLHFSNAYRKDVPIYIHTSREVSKGRKSLEDYAWGSPVIKEFVKGKSLGDLDIHLSGSSPSAGLALSDESLDAALLSAIKSIRSILIPGEPLDNGSAECYLGALLVELSSHIKARHLAVSQPKVGGSFDRKMQCLGFDKIFSVLERNIRDFGLAYYALRARVVLDRRIERYLQDLRDSIKVAGEMELAVDEYIEQIQRVNSYRDKVLLLLDDKELLLRLKQASPHLEKRELGDIYYMSLTPDQQAGAVFLRFIAHLKSTPTQFFAVCPGEMRYSPSFIDADNYIGVNALHVHRKISGAIVGASDREDVINSLIYDFHYIVIKSYGNLELDMLISEARVGNDYDDGLDETPKFYEPLATRLIDIDTAVKRIC